MGPQKMNKLACVAVIACLAFAMAVEEEKKQTTAAVPPMMTNFLQSAAGTAPAAPAKPFWDPMMMGMWGLWPWMGIWVSACTHGSASGKRAWSLSAAGNFKT